MRQTDITIGEHYLADQKYPLYGAKVKVLRKGLDGRGIEVEIVTLPPGAPQYRRHLKAGNVEIVTGQRLRAPWHESHDQLFAAMQAEEDAIDAMKARLAPIAAALPKPENDWDNDHVYVASVDQVRLSYEAATLLLDQAGLK